MEPGLANTCPRSMSSRFTPLKRAPILSPACAESIDLLNISTPVTTVFLVGRMPTISISSLRDILPLSTLPVATHPLPPKGSHGLCRALALGCTHPQPQGAPTQKALHTQNHHLLEP